MLPPGQDVEWLAALLRVGGSIRNDTLHKTPQEEGTAASAVAHIRKLDCGRDVRILCEQGAERIWNYDTPQRCVVLRNKRGPWSILHAATGRGAHNGGHEKTFVECLAEGLLLDFKFLKSLRFLHGEHQSQCYVSPLMQLQLHATSIRAVKSDAQMFVTPVNRSVRVSSVELFCATHAHACVRVNSCTCMQLNDGAPYQKRSHDGLYAALLKLAIAHLQCGQ